MILFFKLIFCSFYKQNLKYATSKKIAALKAMYFLSFLIFLNFLSLVCFFIILTGYSLRSISSNFWVFFVFASGIIIVTFIYKRFYKQNNYIHLCVKKSELLMFHLPGKLISNLYALTSMLIAVFVGWLYSISI